MTERVHSGTCLCGEVRVTVAAPMSEISGCFCELCRKFGGGVQFGIETPAEAVTLEGPVKVHRSSRLAERGWCDTCGSAVFFRYVAGDDAGYFELSPGLFADPGGARLTRLVFADRVIGGIDLAGDILRVSQRDYEAENPHLNEEPER